MKTNTGRYFVVLPSGRKFCVEPIAARGDKIDGHVYTNGGIGGDETKNDQLGGSIREEDSIITPENGFKNIVMLRPGSSPNGFIERVTSCKTPEDEKRLWEKYKYAPVI